MHVVYSQMKTLTARRTCDFGQSKTMLDFTQRSWQQFGHTHRFLKNEYALWLSIDPKLSIDSDSLPLLFKALKKVFKSHILNSSTGQCTGEHRQSTLTHFLKLSMHWKESSTNTRSLTEPVHRRLSKSFTQRGRNQPPGFVRRWPVQTSVGGRRDPFLILLLQC